MWLPPQDINFSFTQGMSVTQSFEIKVFEREIERLFGRVGIVAVNIQR